MRESALALDEAACAELAAFRHATRVASTQDWAFASALPPHGTAVFVADAQTAGRGRRGRVWQGDPDGALAVTLLRRRALPVPDLPPLGLVTGLAIATGLADLGLGAIRLKWPNDLVVDDAKLGGVLVELRGEALAIGLGLNLDLPHLPGVDQPWTDLRRSGLPGVGRATTLGAVLRRLLPALPRFERDGFAGFAADWPRFDALAGRPIHVIAGDRAEDGLALGIAADGGLRVRHADGERIHHAGEVSVRVAA